MSLSIPHRLSIPHFTPQLLLARLSAHSALTHFAALASFMAPDTAAEESKAAQPTPPFGSAAQPAVLPLRELNKRSALFGAWTVVVRQARVEEYEYTWQSQKRTGKTFSCVLVSTQDPTEYCMGQMRFAKKNENTFRTIQQKISDGLAFTMTKVSIVGDAKKQYTHTPVQTVVNVGDTRFAPLLNSKDHDKCYPEPSATVAGCSHLSTQQLFDVTALVKTISALRPVNDNRVVFDVEIIDGSMTDDKVRTMQLAVFTERPSPLSADAPPMWAFLNQALIERDATPVAFFRIKGVQDDQGTFSFTTTKHTTIIEAATTGKGRSLAGDGARLLGLTNTHSLPIRKFDNSLARDFSQEHATETMCALFGSIANAVTTGVDALDKAEETLWQLNWVRVEEPPAGTNIRTNDGKRLWFPVTVRDCTGTLTLYIQEAAALSLSGCGDADQFEAAFEAGKVWFPQMASVKILRRLKSSSAVQPADQVEVRIVDAAWQNLDESPTEASARLLPLLNADNTSTDIVLPAALRMLRKSPHYTLAVESKVPPIPVSLQASFVDVPSATTSFRPCTQVLALVESSEPSHLQEAGAGGYKITTSHVKDLLDDDPEASGVQLTSFCSLENLQDFKLDPPRTQATKKQAALVLISSVLQASSAGQPSSFMIDSVQLLQPSEVDAVKSCLKRMLYLTTLAGHMASRKRTAPASLTHEESPAKASKCRALGRHPTATPVPEFP